MRSLLAASAAALALLAGPTAGAQSIIRNPSSHPQGPELEPHLTFGPFDTDLGAGFRATFQIGKNNFVSSINNSVGVGVGLDYLQRCRGGCGGGYLVVPVVMQWSFYLTRAWSVFAEPGVLARFDGALHPVFMTQLGARWHFKDTVTLTMRVGWPYWSVGVSFM